MELDQIWVWGVIIFVVIPVVVMFGSEGRAFGAVYEDAKEYGIVGSFTNGYTEIYDLMNVVNFRPILKGFGALLSWLITATLMFLISAVTGYLLFFILSLPFKLLHWIFIGKKDPQ